MSSAEIGDIDCFVIITRVLDMIEKLRLSTITHLSFRILIRGEV